MNLLDYSQRTAVSNEIDLAQFIINYIDQELIACDLINKLGMEEFYVDSTVDHGIYGVTFKIRYVDEKLADLVKSIEDKSVLTIGDKTYNISLTYTVTDADIAIVLVTIENA